MLDKQKSPMLGLHRLNWCGLTGAYNLRTKGLILSRLSSLAALLLIFKALEERRPGMSEEIPFTKIPRPLTLKLQAYRIPGEERQILDVIIEKTFGWGKTEDRIPLSQFTESTGIKKPNVCAYLKKLLLKNIISVMENHNSYIKTYSIPDIYGNSWKPLCKKITLSKNIIVIMENHNASLCFSSTSKESSSKELSKETPISPKGEFEVELLKDKLLEEPKPKPKPKRKATSPDYTPEFLSFWDIYSQCRADSKAGAFKAWCAALNKKFTPEIIMAGLIRNFNWLKSEATRDEQGRNFCPMAATWLNQQRWEENHSGLTPPPGAPAVEDSTPMPPVTPKREFRAHPDGSGRVLTKDGNIWTAEKKKFLTGGIQATCSEGNLRKVGW